MATQPDDLTDDQALTSLPGEDDGFITGDAIHNWLYKHRGTIGSNPQRHTKGEGPFVLAHYPQAGAAPSSVHASDCYHPPDKLTQRTQLPPPPLTPFRIHQNWRNENDLNWTKYADVRVQVRGVAERIYLLPSGATGSAIHDPRHWGRYGKERKRKITEAWCILNERKPTEGYLFDMKSPSGPLVPRMYCRSYDTFLRQQVSGA